MITEKIAIARIRAVMLKKGYAFWDDGELNLNIIGIRKADGKLDAFDDWLTCIYRRGGEWFLKEWQATTEPGTYWTQNFENPNGVAILMPNQYRGCYSIGLHNGKYEALVQTGAVTVYRDNNKDAKLDLLPEKKDTGWFGINIHRAHETWLMDSVSMWSAGCQVVRNPKDFAEFMGIVKEAAAIWGPKFTYTLLDEMDLYA